MEGTHHILHGDKPGGPPQHGQEAEEHGFPKGFGARGQEMGSGLEQIKGRVLEYRAACTEEVFQDQWYGEEYFWGGKTLEELQNGQ